MSDEQLSVERIYPVEVDRHDLDEIETYVEELWEGTKDVLFQFGVLRNAETAVKVQAPSDTEGLRYENNYTWHRTGRERTIDDGEYALDELDTFTTDDGEYHVLPFEVKKNGRNQLTVEALAGDTALDSEDYILDLDGRGYRR